MKHPSNCTILIVEDDPNDQLLISRAFSKISPAAKLQILSDGLEAIAYLNGSGKYSDRAQYPFPSMLITDLKMPRANGFDVLKHLLSNPNWSVIPAIVLSASPDGDDIKKAYIAGATSYMVKPSSSRELESLLRKFSSTGPMWMFRRSIQMEQWCRQRVKAKWGRNFTCKRCLADKICQNTKAHSYEFAPGSSRDGENRS